MAPLVIRDHAIVGVSGDVTDLRGDLVSLSIRKQVRCSGGGTPSLIRANPDRKLGPKSDAIQHGGGMPWMPGTYDSELNLILFWNGQSQSGARRRLPPRRQSLDLLHRCVNPDAGKLAWYFQVSPHDLHHWDAVETPVLFDDNSRESSASSSRRPVATANSSCWIEPRENISLPRPSSTDDGREK